MASSTENVDTEPFPKSEEEKDLKIEESKKNRKKRNLLDELLTQQLSSLNGNVAESKFLTVEYLKAVVAMLVKIHHQLKLANIIGCVQLKGSSKESAEKLSQYIGDLVDIEQSVPPPPPPTPPEEGEGKEETPTQEVKEEEETAEKDTEKEGDDTNDDSGKEG